MPYKQMKEDSFAFGCMWIEIEIRIGIEIRFAHSLFFVVGCQTAIKFFVVCLERHKITTQQTNKQTNKQTHYKQTNKHITTQTTNKQTTQTHYKQTNKHNTTQAINTIQHKQQTQQKQT